MKIDYENRERRNGILDFVLFAMPFIGILAILLSNDHPRTLKITALIATGIGLIGAVIFL